MFYAKTNHTSRIKALFELLNNNLKTICLTIDADGIRLKSITTMNQMIDVNLKAANFTDYKFDFDCPQHVGMESSNICKVIKSMNNKNEITFEITEPGNFTVGTILPEDLLDNIKTEVKHSIDVITEIVQNVSNLPFTEYIVPSIKIPILIFNIICKAPRNANEFSVTKENSKLYITIINNISTEKFSIGTNDPTDNTLLHQVYKSGQICRIMKLSSFTNKAVEVFFEEKKPLMIQATSELGTINVYFM